ncbi:MAG: Clp protease N-terminal domain-containing protein [Crocinitomicaceae bacterium]
MIGTEHLLLSILKDEESVSCRVLNKYGISTKNVKEYVITKIQTPRFLLHLCLVLNFSRWRKKKTKILALNVKPTDPKSKNSCFG